MALPESTRLLSGLIDRLLQQHRVGVNPTYDQIADLIDINNRVKCDLQAAGWTPGAAERRSGAASGESPAAERELHHTLSAAAHGGAVGPVDDHAAYAAVSQAVAHQLPELIRRELARARFSA